MHDTEAQQLLLEIIEHAQEAKLSEFRLITSLGEHKYYRGKVRSYKLLVKGLKKSANRLFKKYCKSVTAGISNLTTLLAYQRLIQTLEFYQKELDTFVNMLDEYETYLFSGNIFWTIAMGMPRTEDQMRDYRK
jgi:lipoate-protein ligase A